MAIKFTFTLNDQEAENLFDLLRHEQNSIDKETMAEMAGKNRKAYVEWHKKHKRYVGKIMTRMLSCQERLPDSKDFEVDT